MGNEPEFRPYHVEIADYWSPRNKPDIMKEEGFDPHRLSTSEVLAMFAKWKQCDESKLFFLSRIASDVLHVDSLENAAIDRLGLAETGLSDPVVKHVLRTRATNLMTRTNANGLISEAEKIGLVGRINSIQIVPGVEDVDQERLIESARRGVTVPLLERIFGQEIVESESIEDTMSREEICALIDEQIDDNPTVFDVARVLQPECAFFGISFKLLADFSKQRRSV